MRRMLPALIGLLAILLITSILFRTETKNVSAALSTHLVISEVQIAGISASEDFIELYNPTSAEVNLGDMRLVKRTSSGTTDTDIVVFGPSDTISAHGYYLWCNTSLAGTLSCDKSSSDTVSNSNSVGLRNEPANTGTLIDALTFGSPASPLGEGASLTAPVANSSVERKASSTSDSTSMGSGGADELAGNGEDTDDNAADFVSRAISQPQNSLSAAEIPVTPTPTPTEAPTPSPTPEPSASPTPSPSPTPTPEPSATPTPSPTPTVSPSPSPAPPTPTPLIVARGPNFTCSLIRKSIRIFNRTFFYPSVGCVRF